MSKYNYVISSVGEVTEVANNIINLYTPFIEEIKNNNEKIRKVYLTKTGRERSGCIISTLNSIFGITPPDVVVEAHIGGEVCGMNITNHLFNSYLCGGYATVALYGKNRIEETFEDKITHSLKNLISEAESCITQQLLKAEKEKFMNWVKTLITNSDNEEYSTRLLNLVANH